MAIFHFAVTYYYTFDPAISNNETEYFHSFILFYSFDMPLINMKSRLFNHIIMLEEN